VILGPWRAGRAARASDERLDIAGTYQEMLRRIYGLLASAVLMHLEAEVTSRTAHGQLIHHAVRAALQLI
jgi:hypothetical protein